MINILESNLRLLTDRRKMTLRLLYMSAKIIQMMAFTQIMVIWKPWRSP